MAENVVNLSRLAFESYEWGARFAARWADVSRRIGGRKLGCGLWVVPAGKATTPYHCHLVDEELFIVLDGQPSIRLDGAEHRLAAGDLVAVPPGSDGAHQVLNRGPGEARLLVVSTMRSCDVVGYPDSGKRLYAVSGLAAEPDREQLVVAGGQLVTGKLLDRVFAGEDGDTPLPARGPDRADRDRRIVSIDAGDWSAYESAPFRAHRCRLGRAAGARGLGCSGYRIDPGERPWPYHLHHVNEELVWVRAGSGMLRTPDGEIAIAVDDVALFPTGRAGAHGFRAGDDGLEILSLSTMEEPDVCEYPDSDKVFVMVGAPPGGDRAARTLDLIFRRADAVSYEEGES